MSVLSTALFIAASALAADSQSVKPETARRDRPNIVFILADDLGYTDVACYGSKYYETPNIDRLAAQGLRFTNGYTCGPNCQPTRAALMSGQYGPRTGVYTVGNIDRFNWQSRPMRPVDNVTGLPLEKITIAQTLKSAGYATAMFGKWHLGEDASHHPSRRGFDEAIVSAGKHFNFETKPKVDVPEGAYLAGFLTEKAVDFIRRHKEQPFFLYLPHYGVHSPYEAKPELISRFKDKPPARGHHDPTYAAMIASVDESVGRITATLDELGLSSNTLVIFSSDNGGVGGYTREGIDSAGKVTDNAPLRGGKGMLYEGGIRVPYIFRWTGKIDPASTCRQAINSVDLYPTLAELAGARRPENYPLDGISYADMLTTSGQAQSQRHFTELFWHFPGYLGAGKDQWRTLPVSVIRSGEWKLMEFIEDGRLELYNLSEDLSETKNLAAEKPEMARKLQARLHEWRDHIHAPMPQAKTGTTKPADSDRPAKPRKNKLKRANRAGA